MPRTALEHIREKLKRANEHIEQLEREVEAFLDEAPNRSIINDNPETTKVFEEFHRNRTVAPRLSVVTGDGLYQLRSSLDHLICALIKRERGNPTNNTQFPIVVWRTKEQLRRYDRQIAGISRPEVLATIERFQPYHGATPRNELLAVLKALNNADKHRSLVLSIVVPERRIEFRSSLGPLQFSTAGPDDGTDPPKSILFPDGQEIAVKDIKRSVTTYVAFDQWGDGGTQYRVSIVIGLQAIYRRVDEIVVALEPFLL